jgi:glycosyltransferase involved in cell wall biosynthesis
MLKSNRILPMKISVIVPAYNASTTLMTCLEALKEDGAQEIIVVNDCSTDETVRIAESLGARAVTTPQRGGPAAARNIGAASASGSVLFFVDSDVVIKRGTLDLIENAFSNKPGVAAVFGSYDESPAQKNFLSQYKNLLHHFVHQTSSRDANTFWAGCGAIRKEVFDSLNGFDARMYTHPSIEDIELGWRIVEMGFSIRLEKELQAKHLKRWTISSLLKADIIHRAYPWSRLIVTTGGVPNELNLQTSQRVSANLMALVVLLLVAAVVSQVWWLSGVAMILLAAVIFLNRSLYQFFFYKKGLLFTIGAIFWHMFYFLYSGATFVYTWVRFKLISSSSFRARQHQLN